MYGDQQLVMGTYAHTRSIVRPYDTDAVNIGLQSKSRFVRTLNQAWPNCKSGVWNFVRNYSDLRDALPLAQRKRTRVTLVNPSTAYTSYGHDVPVHFAKVLHVAVLCSVRSKRLREKWTTYPTEHWVHE